MSAVPGSTPAPAPATPSTGTKILKAATDTLKLVVAMANTPGGLQLATVLLGTTNPAILLVEQFGVRAHQRLGMGHVREEPDPQRLGGRSSDRYYQQKQAGKKMPGE